MKNLGLYWEIEYKNYSKNRVELEKFISSSDPDEILNLAKSFLTGNNIIDIGFVISAYGNFIWNDTDNALFLLHNELLYWSRNQLKLPAWTGPTGIPYENYRIALHAVYNIGWDKNDVATAFFHLQNNDFCDNDAKYIVRNAIDSIIELPLELKSEITNYYLKQFYEDTCSPTLEPLCILGGDKVIKILNLILELKNEKSIKKLKYINLYEPLSELKKNILYHTLASQNEKLSKHFRIRAKELIHLYNVALENEKLMKKNFSDFPLDKKDFNPEGIQALIDEAEWFEAIRSKLTNKKESLEKRKEEFLLLFKSPLFNKFEKRMVKNDFLESLPDDIVPFALSSLCHYYRKHYFWYAKLFNFLNELLKKWEYKSEIPANIINELNIVYDKERKELPAAEKYALDNKIPVLHDFFY